MKCQGGRKKRKYEKSLPTAGAWIEIIQRIEADPGAALSLPTRERGLKSPASRNTVPEYLSLPTRERGLKYITLQLLFTMCSVAPYAGAWIEIKRAHSGNQGPFGSLPTRERGLKLTENYGHSQALNRRSLRGSVGLKSGRAGATSPAIKSLPTRERGLKSNHRICAANRCVVAPYAGAWIEIRK